MKAEIITIGDEILIGQIIDTNSAWMASELNSIGMEVAQISSISDSPQHLVNALNEAKNRADIILLTGGIGPTKDDRTKKVLSEYFNSKLVLHHETLEFITRFFAQRGLGVNQLNRDQALVPECCKVLANPLGTAPGMWFEKDDKIFVSMPGVPFEMKGIMREHVIPQLKSKNGKQVIYHKTVLTQGIPESILAEQISNWEDELPEHIHLAYLPNPGQIRLRFTAFGDDYTTLEMQVKTEIEKLKLLIPDAVFGYDNDTLAGVSGELLLGKNATLSIAESCTGGYIAHQLTSIPGSSRWFNGSVVSYSNQSKTDLLNIPAELIQAHGAVSEEIALEMARNVRSLFKSDYAIATTGIAGPTGGTNDKPVGTVWIAVDSEQGTTAQKFNFANNRERNIIRSSQTALNLLRLLLLKD